MVNYAQGRQIVNYLDIRLFIIIIFNMFHKR
jgi:hypothetical protein